MKWKNSPFKVVAFYLVPIWRSAFVRFFMDFTIAASKFMRSGRFLDLELQKEMELAITTIELAVIDNVGLHGRFGLWRSILRDRIDRVTKENARRVR
jgi:hypothetical protein